MGHLFFYIKQLPIQTEKTYKQEVILINVLAGKTKKGLKTKNTK